AMVALVGVIIVWFLFMRSFQDPLFFTIAINEYDPSFPVYEMGRRDSDALFERFDKESRKAHHDNQDRQQFLQRLEKLSDALKNARKNALVVHLSGFARSDGGKLYLLPSKARLHDPSSWLPMEDVLRRIADARVRRTLVILDIYQPLDNPRLGMLADDVATPLQDLFRKKFAAEMLLLCPCQPGEVPLVSEEMGQSAFGYYLEEGLRGFADGYNDTEYRDRRVTVRELADFVKARVGRWALRNRGVRQTPVLLGERGDFALVVKEESDKLEENPPLADLKYPAFLDKAWQVRDEWLASYPVAPEQVHQLETSLLRLEKSWRSRMAQGDLQKQLQDDMRKFEDQVKEAREAADLP